MRPGTLEDLGQIVELFRHEVEVGRQDSAPSESRTRARLARFDWSGKSRVIERNGHLEGAVLVVARPGPEGVLADVYAAGRGDAYGDAVEWGVLFAQAAGATLVHTMMARGRGDGLERLGLRRARPWWRMDRSLGDALPDVTPVAGYELLDATSAAPGLWTEMFNRSFADHWRFAPRTEAEIVGGKSAALCLMAVTSTSRLPAAITLGEIEEFAGDPRPQPVGVVSSVGTVPEHRRRGLAGWLVAEVMRRLRDAGARHASLYVDGLNPMRAYDVYVKLGFEVVYEAEVWEASFR
ncbi:MAG TPA: GNAT family N-acetyltransferase [Candidatus Dormibacteraeota bacterium]|nr:GNAT family N-acetyltransferase [Candidatus Dormibacteraeota bacterium]